MNVRAQRRHAHRWASRGRQRGNVAVLFALLLTVLVGTVALVVDIGNGWKVDAELQNAADSAAIAGALDLNGTAAQFPLAIADAVAEANRNKANMNPVSVPVANVTLGNWAFPNGPFIPFVAQPANQINAVRVISPTLSVQTFFAPLLGKNSENVQARAVAAGGGPINEACGFPIAVPSCAITNPDGSLNCQAQLTFNGNTNNSAFTLYLPGPPLNTPNITCAFAVAARTLQANCPMNCNCTPAACTASNANQQIWIGNGNNLSKAAVDAINADVAANQPAGLFVTVPIFQMATCGGNLSNAQTINGYAQFQVLGATNAPSRQIQLALSCNRTTPSPPGGNFFGFKSTQVYLAQ
jgi:Putative Flp pilus-assembly TadE/G-like